MFKTLDKQEYEEALQSFSDYHFTQSAEQDYQQIMYGNCHYVAWYKKEKPVILLKFAITQILGNQDIALASFGPIINCEEVTQNIFNNFIQELKSYLKQNNLLFIQIYPALLNEEISQVENLIKGNNLLKKAPKKFTWLDGTMILSLNQDLENIFGNFRKDVKYNIKKAERESLIKTEIIDNPKIEDFDDFFRLYEKQQERKSFKDSASNYYKDLFEKEKLVFFFAKDQNGELISAIMAVKFRSQNTLITYLSASVGDAFKKNAPTLLRWDLIKWAKENNFERVDFFSLDKKTPSVSNFKKGFRPTIIEFGDYAYNLTTNPQRYFIYYIYQILKNLKKKINL